MKNSTRAIPVFVLAALAMLITLPLSSSAFALEYYVEYDSVSQYIKFGHTGGVSEGQYTIETPDTAGCVVFAEEIPVINGVSGDDSVKVTCVAEGNGCGHMEIGYCRINFGCLEYFDFYFRCIAGCIILQIDEGDCLPSVSEWGLLILLVLLLASGAYVIRRKRALATR